VAIAAAQARFWVGEDGILLSWKKFPIVASRMEVELEDPIVRSPRLPRLLTVDFAVGRPRRTHRVVWICSPGADYELADAVG
jgi:hypothetical protein